MQMKKLESILLQYLIKSLEIWPINKNDRPIFLLVLIIWKINKAHTLIYIKL